LCLPVSWINKPNGRSIINPAGKKDSMARTQAADYGVRREAIVEKAARLYAERGFLGASISDLAKVCRISKSLIYHYYPSKEDILFDVMHSHVRALLDTAEAITARGRTMQLRLAIDYSAREAIVAAARRTAPPGT